jgi:hypothetical protein
MASKDETDIVTFTKERSIRKLLVVINTNVASEASSLLKLAQGDQESPEGVQQIFDNTLLIDIHKCLPLFVSLLYISSRRQFPVAVFAVDDEALLFKGPLKLPPEHSI